ncbi:flavoprotein [Frankia sp. CNm7]|uniref:Flavoprotein n=1 Tax=Frankia nepalensis TaxID=1836974 RepID=A0A937RLJ9_9ACTN|nr:flavoprotein [Frankia nepalensis]MBL7499789.1 flavoprotein [Frankia nepalensis]MBL7512274.1 flavoprotein [Frankia nepalensis]MBL7520441.1 flavoprotein [Frankia nepalensis]MBL7632577.1 flavoprotein [Frankia nepalensis]
MASRAQAPVLHVVACAAPPAKRIEELVRLAQSDGWSVCVIPTPSAAEWLDVAVLAEATGQPVRARARRPDEPKLPPADAVAMVPATFNTINKCAAGINDSAALGVVNEAVGLRVPVVVAPYVKATLAAHPAFARALGELAAFGFTVLPTNVIQPPEGTATFMWRPVLDALARDS